MTNRISVSNPTQPVISVTDEGGVLVTVNYQNSTGGGGGTGDVVGPASSTDNAIARYDGTTGKLIQDSGITIADGATGTLAGSNSGDVTLGASVTDIFNLTGQVLSADDQGADRLVFWDESENKLTALTAGSGLSISGTTITATATGDVVGPASSTDNALVRFDSTTGKLVQNGQITESDTGDLAAINSLAFDTTPTGSIAAQGEVMWNSDEETIDIQLNSFAQHVGEHVLYHVKNSTGSTIAKGVPVMFAGTNGASGKLLVQPWNGTGPSTYFMGLTAEELLDTEEGFVISFGKLRGIQTNGGNYGETWADGEIIYVGTTSGSLTKTQPAAPNPHIQVCAVVNAHASNGTLFIRPTLGSNIKDDEGVTITSLSSGQLLIANNAGTVFENKSMSGDATLANTGALTLATVNSNVGSFGSATAAPAVTVNAKGLVTAVSTNTITPAVGSITGLGTGVSTALAVNVGTSGAFVANGGALGTPSSGTLTSCTGLPISTGVSGLGTNVAASLANAMSASGTLAILGANTFTGVQTISTNGALSAPAFTMTGTAVTGGTSTTTKPLALIEPSGATSNNWSTNGTMLGINAATGFTGDLLTLQLNAAARFRVDQNGSVYMGKTTPSLARRSDVDLLYLNSVETGRAAAAGALGIRFGGSTQLQFTNDLPASTVQTAISWDGGGYVAIRNGSSLDASTTPTGLRVYNIYTNSTNYERAMFGFASNVLNVGTEKGSGGGTARAMQLVTDGTSRVNIGAAGEIGLYGVTAVARATTAGAAATFVTNTSGILNDTATFDGYTIGQVVKALRNVGILT